MEGASKGGAGSWRREEGMIGLWKGCKGCEGCLNSLRIGCGGGSMSLEGIRGAWRGLKGPVRSLEGIRGTFQPWLADVVDWGGEFSQFHEARLYCLTDQGLVK